MLQEIDGLKMPATVDGTAELFSQEAVKRSAGSKLITKLAPEKWRVTVNYETTNLSVGFQGKFYEKCLKSKSGGIEIVFISPYDGQEIRIIGKCISRQSPKALFVSKGKPGVYGQAGAVFEEI